jgi:HlyD family secretion protein
MKTLLSMVVGLLLVTGGGVGSAYPADDAKPEYQPKLFRGPAASGKNAPAASGKNVLATGTIEPEEMIDVCAEVAGTIVSLGADPHAPGKSIDYGSPVEAGTVLAQIDSQLYAVRVERERAGCVRAEAELAQAMINLERADAQWQRSQALEAKKAISDSDLELTKFNDKAAKVSVTAAKALLAQKQAALKEAEIELSYTTIKSPIKGVVIDRRVNVGQMVAPANTSSLFLVGKLDKLVVWASVNEADIARVHQKQAVRFTVDALPGKVFEGKVEQIRMNATMAQNVVTYTVVVAISEPGPTFTPGGTIGAAAGAKEKLLPYMTASLEFE